MGTNIDREAFDEVDDARFQQRLEQCLATLGELLERPGFGVGPAMLGAELELCLLDAPARPLRQQPGGPRRSGRAASGAPVRGASQDILDQVRQWRSDLARLDLNGSSSPRTRTP